MGYCGLELIDTVIKVADVTAYLEAKGVPGIWDIADANITIRPDGMPVLCDYTLMRPDPVRDLEYLLSAPWGNEYVAMNFVKSENLNTLIMKEFLALHEKVKRDGFRSIAEFREALTVLRNAVARYVLEDLLRDTKNYYRNRKTIARLKGEISGEAQAEGLQTGRPYPADSAAAALGRKIVPQATTLPSPAASFPVFVSIAHAA